MKTLTIRLSDSESNLLANYMDKNGIATASRALLHALESSYKDQITISSLLETITAQQNTLDGLLSAREALKHVLNYLDQVPLL